jgi:hypothetical protein
MFWLSVITFPYFSPSQCFSFLTIFSCEVNSAVFYRELWQNAIKQQILLDRMERENRRIIGGLFFMKSANPHVRNVLNYKIARCGN